MRESNIIGALFVRDITLQFMRKRERERERMKELLHHVWAVIYGMVGGKRVNGKRTGGNNCEVMRENVYYF